MPSILLTIIVVVDFLLLGIIYYLGKQRFNPVDLIKELTEERKTLNEIRRAVKEDIGLQETKSKKILERISALATEIEMEVKSGGNTLTEEVERILAEVGQRIEEPMDALSKKQVALELLSRRVEREKQGLVKVVNRAEKLVKFFDKNVAYESILEEIEDKKYLDARHLIAQGMSPRQVSQELGLPQSEVELLIGLSQASG